MNKECEVIRDLLPLYADDVCSQTSRELIEEHLHDCPECSAVLEKLRKNEIENNLKEEKDQVIEYQAKRFKRRSATVGSVVSGLFMVPILICFIVNMATGSSLSWFYLVLGGLAIVASWTLVPLMVPRNKLFWSFCAFVLSILFTLAVSCFYSHGDWFFLAASSFLFAAAHASSRPVARHTWRARIVPRRSAGAKRRLPRSHTGTPGKLCSKPREKPR